MTKYQAGRYQSEAQGFLDKVKLSVDVSNDKVEHVSVEENETPDVGGYIIGQLVEQVNASGKTQLDSVAGATHSSKAFTTAYADALRQARGEEVSDPYIPGTYTAQADGYKGVVSLAVTFSHDKIKQIDYDGVETADLGGQAIEKISRYVEDTQNPDFDYVSGATYSSRAMKEALDDSIAQAKDTFQYDDLPFRRQEATIDLGTGQVTLKELKEILNHLPLEITFVDKHDRFVYFNHRRHQELAGTPRSRATLGSYVLDCHPPKIREKVGGIIKRFKKGQSRSESMWYTKSTGQKFFLSYIPLFDVDDDYLGLLEFVQEGNPFIETAGVPWNRQTHNQEDVNPFINETQADVDAWLADRKAKGIDIGEGADFKKAPQVDARTGATAKKAEQAEKPSTDTDATTSASHKK